MSYVGYGQSPYVQEPKVRFDAIGEAWALTREKMGVWATAMLVVGFASLVMYGILAAILFAAGLITAPSPSNPDWFSLPAQIISNLLGFVFSGFLTAGLMRMAIKQVRGQDIQVSDVFSAGDAVGNAVTAQLVYGILTTLGTYLCIIPGLIVSGRGMLTMPIAVDKGANGIDAFKRSWDATKSDTLNAVLFAIVLSLVSSLGVLACGIGALFTAPIFYLGIAITYRDFFEQEVGMRGPTLDMPLPPASAYGDSRFGSQTGVGQYTAPGTPPAPGRLGDVSPGTTPSPQKPPETPGQMGSIDM